MSKEACIPPEVWIPDSHPDGEEGLHEQLDDIGEEHILLGHGLPESPPTLLSSSESFPAIHKLPESPPTKASLGENRLCVASNR